MRARITALFCVSALLLGACGGTTKDRLLSGTGIGAGAGAATGALFPGISVVGGALAGALAGALTGGLTDESQIDLGQPIWR